MFKQNKDTTIQNNMRDNMTVILQKVPEKWNRFGIVMQHGQEGSYDMSVIGDPCIIWDAENKRYRMYYFGQAHAEDGREINENCLAISRSETDIGPGDWKKLGILKYTNKEIIDSAGHKAYIVCDPMKPNTPVRIKGKYWFFQSVYSGYNKRIMVAKADSLDGPWTNQEQPVIDLGPKDAFDGYNCDSPTAYWFESEQKVLIFYKGYPSVAQTDQPVSPLGSVPAAAVMGPDDEVATKLGKILELPQEKGHWAAGWMSTPQIVKAASSGWFGVVNGSSTTPAPIEEEPAMREPLPSRGGWMYTPEEFPVSGWRVFKQPFNWLAEAMKMGEGPSFWKHGLLFGSDGSIAVYYHAGNYGKEFLYGQRADNAFEPI